MSRFVIVTATVLGPALGAVGSAQAADAKQVYDFYCAQCHGVNGDGKGINVTKRFSPRIRATSPLPQIWKSVPMRTSGV